MRKIISHLKDNWIRHGFETLVVTVGILGAFTLNNWNENSKRNNQEIEILENLLVELNELKKETEAFIENEEYHLKVNKYFVDNWEYLDVDSSFILKYLFNSQFK